MILSVKAPGSCGELMQGTINNQPFLVTCPIDVYSTAIISTSHNELKLYAPKTIMAIQKTLNYLQKTELLYDIQLISDLPQGKGMASSSADITAVSQAVAMSFGKKLCVEELAQLAISIEPTDGIFCEGIVQFNHLTGKYKNLSTIPPAIDIALFDIGGAVDTLVFNQRKDLADLNAQKEPQSIKALQFIQKGLIFNDIDLIGKGATISAFANQTILYKPCLDTVYDIAMACYAVGINIAHSGTVIGMLFPPQASATIPKAIELMKKKCVHVNFLQIAHLISGGLKIEGVINDKII